MKIRTVLGDITKLAVDAIVNAANKACLGGGGVDGAIHRAAGPKLLEECKRLNGCETGDAKLTLGHNLPSKYVIHTVGPIFSDSLQNSIDLRSCYKRCFEIAREKHIKSIAFPAISCGIYGYPIEDAALIALNAATIYADIDMEIIFCLFSEADKKVYDDYLSKYSEVE